MTDPIDPNALPPQQLPGGQPFDVPAYTPPPVSAPPSALPPVAAPLPDHSAYPAYPSGWEELGPPGGRRVSTWVWVAAGVAVLLAVFAATTVVRHDSAVDDAEGTEGRTLVLPSAVNGYRQVQTLNIRQVLDQLADLNGLGISTDQLDQLRMGLYARPISAEPTFFFVGMQVSDIPRLQDEIDADGVAATVKEFTNGVAAGGSSVGASARRGIVSVDPGPLGGSMRCGVVTVVTRDIAVCGWGDRSAVAASLLLDPTTVDEAAELTRDFRAAAEH